MTTTAKRTCLLVLGMHRSGTSALTRVLSLLGAALPKTIMPASEANAAGYWEPLPLVILHEQMLEEAGSRWDDFRSFDPESLGPERLAHYRDAIRNTIAEEYADAPLFVLKDPRICRFAPLYESVLAEMGIATSFVLIHRHPAAVLASLQARDQLEPDYSSLVWLRHDLDAEAATRGKRRVVLSYETLLDDPHACAEHMATDLDRQWPVSWADAAAQIEPSLSRDLQHHRPTDRSPDQASAVQALVSQAYDALSRLPADPNDADAVQALDDIRTRLDAYASFADAAFAEFTARERRAVDTRQQLEATIADLRSASDARKTEHDHVAAALAQARADAAQSERERLHATTAHERERLEWTRRQEETETQLAEQAQAAAETGSLRTQLHNLHGSRDFRLGTAILSRLAAMDPRLLWGRNITLQPGLNTARSGESGHTTHWTLEGDDPQFILFDHRLPPAHYALTIKLPDCDSDSLVADLYVDSGAGYRESERYPLPLRVQHNYRYRATFTLPQGAAQLRMDPPSGWTEMTSGAVRLRRLTRVEYYSRAIGRLVAERRRTGQSLRSAAARALQILSTEGIGELAKSVRRQLRTSPSTTSYETWIARHDELTADVVDQLRRDIAALPSAPLISVLMPVYNPSEPFLRDAIESVRNQIYDNWQLCIADDCSTLPHVAKVLHDYAAADDRIDVTFREQNGHISRASNSALERVRGDWVALLDHDDVLRPHALAEVALEIARHPDAELIYSDEDKLSETGVRFDPFFKPDFSRELFRSQNYLNHLTVHRTRSIRAVGGWRPGFEGSQDYDLNLRIFERINAQKIRHIPKVLYHWRAASGSTALAGAEKGYAYEAGYKALVEHVARTGLNAQVEQPPGVPFYRLRLAVPDPAPLVSLIIPTRDQADLLRTCIKSILEKTTYAPYEIIVVDNGTSERDALAYLDELRRHPAVRVLDFDQPFNFSAINNFAVSQARGDVVGLINNDIEVITPDWLSEMVSWAMQPDVGCVGAKLYYPDDTIQHAGIILGIGGVANHAHLNSVRNSPGYFGRAVVMNNWSAVTGACLLVRKDTYVQVGGLCESNLPVAFNDVDFCLRVRDQGYSNVWTPYAELYHHESVSRGADNSPQKRQRFLSEVAYMESTWGEALLRDPYYSKGLSQTRGDFSLAE